MKKFLLFGLLLASLLVLASARVPPPAPDALPAAPIEPVAFQGWTNAYRLQSDLAEAVFVPEVGRLVSFSMTDGASPFRLAPELAGKTPAAGEPFFNLGGDWLWPVAQARWPALSEAGTDWPPPPVLADQPWQGAAWKDVDGRPCLRLSRNYGAPLHIQVSRLFQLATNRAELVVQQRIERLAPSEIPVVLWNISQIAQAEQIALPVDKTSRFRGGLKALMGRLPKRPHLVRCGNVAVYGVHPGGETKLGADSPRAWIAAARGPQIVFESVANTTPGDYPDGGCIVEVYSNHGLGYSEIETLSVETNLPAGAILENTLRITLAPAPSAPNPCSVAAAARALAGE